MPEQIPSEAVVSPAIRRDAARKTGPIGILSGDEFQWFLERERSLADRGGRFFTLLVLQPRSFEPRGVEQLALQLRERLRQTDLIGFVDGGGLGVLLADTLPEGSKIVASWVDHAVDELGLVVDSKIYVYPSVDEAVEMASKNGTESKKRNPRAESHGNPEDGEDIGPGSNGNGRHRSAPSRGANGRADAATPVEDDTPPADDAARIVRSANAPDAPWPMEDLWTQLSIPLPFWKRALDVVLSGLALVALSPLFLVVAIVIRLESRGPVFFKQKRAGRGARPFTMYKFRSMVLDAEERRRELVAMNEQTGPVFKIRNDPRVTRFGRLLRRWSFDELPQIWNVFKGDISLVGPRSPTFEELAEYERWHRRRLSVTGGMTCIWQVSGRSQIGFREWMRMDMAYVARRSPWLDLKLLGKTVTAILSGRGAY